MNDEPLTVGHVVQQLTDRRNDAVSTLELIEGLHVQVEAERAGFENPQAVLDYLAFFRDFIGRALRECDRISAELATGAQPGQVTTLRELASISAVEQRRCLLFRDKIINKPLPQERLRPLLNEISITTRDQLTAFRDFTRAADRLEQLLAANPPKPPSRELDRRALFTRLLRRDSSRS